MATTFPGFYAFSDNIYHNNCHHHCRVVPPFSLSLSISHLHSSWVRQTRERREKKETIHARDFHYPILFFHSCAHRCMITTPCRTLSMRATQNRATTTGWTSYSVHATPLNKTSSSHRSMRVYTLSPPETLVLEKNSLSGTMRSSMVSTWEFPPASMR